MQNCQKLFFCSDQSRDVVVKIIQDVCYMQNIPLECVYYNFLVKQRLYSIPFKNSEGIPPLYPWTKSYNNRD